jgi:carboxymethylenebutenolidase
MAWFSLQAKDGHSFNVFEQTPDQNPTGMVIVFQEIFGVNSHIESVGQQLAQQGWFAITPALFDRSQGQQDLV